MEGGLTSVLRESTSTGRRTEHSDRGEQGGGGGMPMRIVLTTHCIGTAHWLILASQHTLRKEERKGKGDRGQGFWS